ncbi:MAG: lipid-A-disaccharide synthase [FCB group bacterium]|nr:lipid-A-disaccharide synthase [FCB group bacterium]
MPAPSFFIVAGEASGDLHGSRLMRSLRALLPEARFRGHGGDRMVLEGLDLDRHIDQLSVMGFSEVIRKLPFMIEVMKSTVESLASIDFDRLILIDYPGFNLRLAKKVQNLKLPITYFILPQVWAWKENRIHTLVETTDQRLSIFPFEQSWFQDRGVDVDFVGHPFADLELPQQPAVLSPQLILLPGSRQQEIDRHWKTFVQTAELLRRQNEQLSIHVVRFPGVTLDPLPDWIRISTGNTLAILQQSTAALVASGTASLEAAVADCPAVVCYRLSSLSWFLARNLVKVKYASMVNLIADEPVVPEFLQNEMVPDALAKTLAPLLAESAERKAILNGYQRVRSALGKPGVYDRAAQAIVSRMRDNA